MAGTWAVSTPFGVLVPQGSVEYVHEFMDDQRVIYFRLAQDGAQTKLRFLGDPPDRNYFQMGLGLSLQLAKGITPFVAYRALGVQGPLRALVQRGAPLRLLVALVDYRRAGSRSPRL